MNGALSDSIVLNTRPINDLDWIRLDSWDNRRISDYNVTNYRTPETTKNPYYVWPYHHKLYDLQNIQEGQGGGMNPDLDTLLTRREQVNLPADRLNEKVTFIRYVDFLPPPPTPQYSEIDNQKFLVQTTTPVDPQVLFDPRFDRYGVNARHNIRTSDEFFRKIAMLDNGYRKKSKYIKQSRLHISNPT